MTDAAAPADVAVLGAGPAGAACALALAQAGVGSVLLVDSGRRPGAVAIGETIPPDTRLLLDRLGLWDSFLAEGHEPCLGSCSAWGSDTLGHNDFLLNPQGPGWHLDRARFDAMLRRAARAAGVRMTAGGRESASAVRGARFVVDATGRASAHARSEGARQVPLDRLTFVYGFFDTAGSRSRSRLTLLEAAPHGWWYAAALPEGRLAVAFATDAERVRSARLSTDAGWFGAALATRHLAPRLEGCRFIAGSLVARVAPSFALDRTFGPRWLAIGDAASSFDPLAAQGIHKALEDALSAASLIAAAVASGNLLGGEHDAAIRRRVDDYVANRNHFYGLERRWPASPFWQRRQSRTGFASAA